MAHGREQAADVRLQGGSAGGGQQKTGDGLAVAELLFNLQHPGGLESAGVGGEIAIGQVSHPAKLHEILAFFDDQSGQNLQAAGIGDDGIEGHVAIIGHAAA